MTAIPPSLPDRPDIPPLQAKIEAWFKTAVSESQDRGEDISIVLGQASALPAYCNFLFHEAGCSFGGLNVEERQEEWRLLYLFLLPGTGWIHVILRLPLAISTVPSISPQVHAADWYEREAEDLFGLRFEQHPRLEKGAHLDVPARASGLRVALSELERLRHHAGAIEAICQSTALNVSEAQAAIVEEQLLRASCCFAGHRYLFGLNTPGGLRRDFDAPACRDLLRAVDGAVALLRRLEDRLRYTSSFLDRLEDVGAVTREAARDLDLAGPVGRASGLANDLRSICPYAGYREYAFEPACEKEGDGYARLRVLFHEARQSARLIDQAIEALQPGEVCVEGQPTASGSAMGWVEAPIGAAVHWLRLNEDGRIGRYRILSPSFRNWLGIHAAVEDFAFQDFPIILATFGLSATECDR